MSRSQRLLSAAFVGAGVLHFVRPRMYEAIMPGYLPAHHELVLLSGAAEIAGGLGVAIGRTRRTAGWGLVALLVAVFPANVEMALHPEPFEQIPAVLLWARLPLQGALIWWVLSATRPPSSAARIRPRPTFTHGSSAP